MNLTLFAGWLTMAALLPAQSQNAPVVVAEKNVAELKKTREVIVLDGAMGTHPAPEVNGAASAEFADAISKQLEHLTCWKVLPGTSPRKKSAGNSSKVLATYVENTEIRDAARRTVSTGALFQFMVLDGGGTEWDGSQRVGRALGKEGFYTPAQIQGMVADMLKALAMDACPGTPMSAAGPAAVAPTASFDCSKAVSRSEKLICSSPALSNADAVMAVLYGRSITFARNIFPDAAANLKRDQIEWTRENATCKDGACLQKQYDERIAFLKEYQAAAHDDIGVNGMAMTAFLTRYPWRFRLLPGLLQELKSLLGDTYNAFEDAMGIVHVYLPDDPGTITGNMRNMNCAVEAIVSVNGGRRLAVAVTAGESMNVISVFSKPRATGLAELPKVKSWVEEFQKRCGDWGKWEVKLR
jgi:hypothetical protein